jgi:hypothetical protein
VGPANPQSREAFARVEQERRGTQVARFDSDGKLTWEPCAEPESIDPLPYVTRAYGRNPADLDRPHVDSEGRVTWHRVPEPMDSKQIQYVKRWLAKSTEEKAPFLARATRHIPDWDNVSYQYGAYCLYARGRVTPVSVVGFAALKKATNYAGRATGRPSKNPTANLLK